MTARQRADLFVFVKHGDSDLMTTAFLCPRGLGGRLVRAFLGGARG